MINFLKSVSNLIFRRQSNRWPFRIVADRSFFGIWLRKRDVLFISCFNFGRIFLPQTSQIPLRFDLFSVFVKNEIILICLAYSNKACINSKIESDRNQISESSDFTDLLLFVSIVCIQKAVFFLFSYFWQA